MKHQTVMESGVFYIIGNLFFILKCDINVTKK